MGTSAFNEVNAVREIMLKHARDAFRDQSVLHRQWRSHGYTACPDYTRAIAEYDEFTAFFQREDISIQFLPPDSHTTIDSIYVRDAAVFTPHGAVLCNMGKAERKSEPAALRRFLIDRRIPLLGRIDSPGTLEGGDVVWFDRRTLAVGQGYRTNSEGIRQLRAMLGSGIDELLVVSLPHWQGPRDVFHLMSMISPIHDNLAVVFSKPMPVHFREWLLRRKIELIEVPEPEFETMGGNILAISPSKCLMVKGNPRTRQALEEAGIEVFCYQGREISLKGGGGPTCLTRPLNRQ